MNHRFPILIVEDDRLSRKFLETTIRKTGNEVVSVENGKKALEIMSERFFPIILTDWMMPEMDGIELCKAISPTTSVIVL